MMRHEDGQGNGSKDREGEQEGERDEDREGKGEEKRKMERELKGLLFEIFFPIEIVGYHSNYLFVSSVFFPFLFFFSL